MNFSYLLIIFMLSVSVAAERILAVFPIPSVSHQVIYRPLTQELARAGHQVVVLTTDPAFQTGKAPANLTEIDLHDISYDEKKAFLALITGKISDVDKQYKAMQNVMQIVLEKQMLSEEVQKLFEDQSSNFDLLIIETTGSRPALAFSHVYNVPVVQVSALGTGFYDYKVVGGATHPLLYPNVKRQKLHNLTMWNNISIFYNEFLDYFETEIEDKSNDMIKRVFGPEIPTLDELSDNVDMLFLNQFSFWEGNFPAPPSVIYVGGIHERTVSNLPKDLMSYLDASVNGVIYMSFGSNAIPSALPFEKVQMFVKVFSRLPYDILWKWDRDELPGMSKNIRIGKWFPQTDLLSHPKIKLFITHGGHLSTLEAITAGVPLIGIPMLTDQWFYTEKYLTHKIGMKLTLETLTEETLSHAINTVLHDESYAKNVARLRRVKLDQPQLAVRRAAWWVQHALRHGRARPLRAPAHNMPLAHYFELELLLTVTLVLVTTLSILVVSVRTIVRRYLLILESGTKNIFLKYLSYITCYGTPYQICVYIEVVTAKTNIYTDCLYLGFFALESKDVV